MYTRIMVVCAFAIFFLSTNASAETIELFCSGDEGREDTVKIELPECVIYHDDKQVDEQSCTSSVFSWTLGDWMHKVTIPSGEVVYVNKTNQRYELSRNSGKLTYLAHFFFVESETEMNVNKVVGTCNRGSRKF